MLIFVGNNVAVREFSEGILDMLTFSPYDEAPKVDVVLHCIKVLRLKSLENDESDTFNQFITRLKSMGDSGDLFPEPWLKIKNSGITLISSSEAVDSQTTEEQAKSVRFSFTSCV